MIRRRRHVRGAFPESMLDLIWILLFYFLMISTVRKKETEGTEETVLIHRVPYSGAEEQVEVRQRTVVAVAINSAGTIVVGGETVAPDALQRKLETITRDREGVVLLVDVDREARVEDLLTVEDTARAAELEVLIRRRSTPARQPVGLAR